MQEICRKDVAMRMVMEKLKVTSVIILAAAVLMGCGKGAAVESSPREDASGDAIVIEEKSWREPAATEEMNKENESAQTIEPEPSEEETMVDPEQLQEPEIEPQEVTETVPEQPAVNRLQIVF